MSAAKGRASGTQEYGLFPACRQMPDAAAQPGVEEHETLLRMARGESYFLKGEIY